MGDPSILHPKFASNKTIDFLKHQKKKLYYATYNEPLEFYGEGWMYDDYNGKYQAEKSSFPVFGNTVEFSLNGNKLQAFPSYFSNYLSLKKDLKPISYNEIKKSKIKREIFSNYFIYPYFLYKNFKQSIPFRTSAELTKNLLEKELNRSIRLISKVPLSSAKTIYGTPTYELYKEMLKESDNFIAEQLLLVCSSVLFNKLDTEGIIKYAKENFFKEISSLQWVDGSGLSRYNLFTPNQLVQVLSKILEEIKNEKVAKGLFAEGGLSGTIKNSYPLDKNSKPFIWAKTGTLSNNYNESGYLITKKGKKYIYSFMNNNFMGFVSPIRKEVNKIMIYIYENF